MKKIKSIIIILLLFTIYPTLSPSIQVLAISTSQVFDMTNTTYVETGGIALGNPENTCSKTHIYAVKCTKNVKDKTNTKSILYSKKIDASSNVKKSKEVSKSLEHANDMTYGYDLKTGKYNLFVASNYDNNIFKLDASDCSYLTTYKTDNSKEKIDAIAHCPILGIDYYVLRKKASTQFHISTLSQKIFSKEKDFSIYDKNNYLDKHVLQGICYYDNHLYIALYDKKNVHSYVYKVNSSMTTIFKGKDKQSYQATKIASFSGSEIESIDIKVIKKKITVFYTANVNAGGEDSGVKDYVGKFTLN